MSNKKLLYGILIGVIFILSIGVTYAWFRIYISGNEEAQDMTVETGTLSIVYTDGNEIRGENIHPGWTESKIFTVENAGSLKAFYSIDFKDLINEIENEEIEIKDNIGIEGGTIHEYEITFEFIETSSVQNYNQGKNFSTMIQINEALESSDMRAQLLDINGVVIANANVEVHLIL